MNNNFNKPKSPLIGTDGNIFNLIGVASNSLREHGYNEEAKQMSKRVMNSSSYEEAISIINEYVEPVDISETSHNERNLIDYE